jgi:uncharacterized membrane protein
MAYKNMVEYSVALFESENGAETAWKALKADNAEQMTLVKETALLRKNAGGKLTIHETGDMGGGKGAAIGAVVGALAGVITGPGVVLTSAAGAAIGGLAAKLKDSGFDNKDLKALAEALKPGTSALMVVLDPTFISEFAKQMESHGAQVIHDALNPQLAGELDETFQGFATTLKEVGADGLTVDDGTSIDSNVKKGRLDWDNKLTSTDRVKT